MQAFLQLQCTGFVLVAFPIAKHRLQGTGASGAVAQCLVAPGHVEFAFAGQFLITGPPGKSSEDFSLHSAFILGVQLSKRVLFVIFW